MNSESYSAADFFDEIVGQYDQAIYRCVPRYDEMLDQMLDYIESQPKSIVELGCGTGNLTSRLLERYPQAKITSVDASGEMIRLSQQRFANCPQAHHLETTFQDLSLPEDSIDLVISSISIHHLNDLEKLELFTKVCKWLKSPGEFTFCDQFSGETNSLYEKHMANWKQASMELGASTDEWDEWMRHQDAHDFHSSLSTHWQLMEKAGFQVIDCTRRYFLWTTMIGYSR